MRQSKAIGGGCVVSCRNHYAGLINAGLIALHQLATTLVEGPS